MEFVLLQRGSVVHRFSAATRQEANQELRAKCSAELNEYTLAQLLRTGTPQTRVVVDRIDEIDQ